MQYSSQALAGLACKNRGADPRHHQEKERISQLHPRCSFSLPRSFLMAPLLPCGRGRMYDKCWLNAHISSPVQTAAPLFKTLWFGPGFAPGWRRTSPTVTGLRFALAALCRSLSAPVSTIHRFGAAESRRVPVSHRGAACLTTCIESLAF